MLISHPAGTKRNDWRVHFEEAAYGWCIFGMELLLWNELLKSWFPLAIHIIAIFAKIIIFLCWHMRQANAHTNGDLYIFHSFKNMLMNCNRTPVHMRNITLHAVMGLYYLCRRSYHLWLAALLIDLVWGWGCSWKEPYLADDDDLCGWVLEVGFLSQWAQNVCFCVWIESVTACTRH